MVSKSMARGSRSLQSLARDLHVPAAGTDAARPSEGLRFLTWTPPGAGGDLETLTSPPGWGDTDWPGHLGRQPGGFSRNPACAPTVGPTSPAPRCALPPHSSHPKELEGDFRTEIRTWLFTVALLTSTRAGTQPGCPAVGDRGGNGSIQTAEFCPVARRGAPAHHRKTRRSPACVSLGPSGKVTVGFRPSGIRWATALWRQLGSGRRGDGQEHRGRQGPETLG